MIKKRPTLLVKLKLIYKYSSIICPISYKNTDMYSTLTVNYHRELQDELSVKVVLVNLYSDSLLSSVNILPTQISYFICDSKVVPLC